MKQLISFFKKETVLSIAGILAVVSAFFVPPSMEYLSYIDFRTLALLYCLMLVVAGMQSIGVFRYLATRLLSGIENTRQLVFVLVVLCFFSSMLITNDVALITFVPFAVLILSMAKKQELMISVIVLQTIAANLGSMMTPIGNPQNLYLYSLFSIGMLDFIKLMFPLTMVSFVLLMAAVFLLKKEELTISELEEVEKPQSRQLIFYIALFVVCLACVAHIIPYYVMLVILVIAILFINPSLMKQVDYFLLLTFLCFFLFIGNIQRIPVVSQVLSTLLASRELYMGVLLSQVISNVPAAVLLAAFTDQAQALLYGINIGGLGTLIASLASVISYRCYANAEGAKKGAYIGTFTLYSIVFLIILLVVGQLLLH